MKRVLVVALALGLTGCAGASIYQPPDGSPAFETSMEAIHLMVQRDMEVARQNTIKEAIKYADSPEDAVVVMGLASQSPYRMPEYRAWYERIIPIMQLLNPWLLAYASDGNGNGSNGGVSIEDSDGASVFFMKGNTVTESTIASQVTPTITKSWSTQTGTEESANDGQYYYQPTDTTE